MGIAMVGALIAVAVFVGLQNAEEPFQAKDISPEAQYTNQISGRIDRIEGTHITLDVSVGRSEELPPVSIRITDQTDIRILGSSSRQGTLADLEIGDEVRVTAKFSKLEQEAAFIEVYKGE